MRFLSFTAPYTGCIPTPANLPCSVSACFLRAMGTLSRSDAITGAFKAPTWSFLYTRHSTLCPVDNMGESRGTAAPASASV
jgi:hypothetical protein